MKENIDFLTRTQQLKVGLYEEYLSKTAETSGKVVLKLKSKNQLDDVLKK